MEFVFAVRNALDTSRQQLCFSIVDLKGFPLSRVIVDELGPQCRIHLHMVDGTPLAWVCTSSLHEQSRSGTSSKAHEPKSQQDCLLEICRPSGEVFCTLSRDRGVPCNRYVLRSTASHLLYIYYGDFRKKTVNVMTPGRQLVCTSEHCPVGFETGPHYQVRVAPHTDAGLMLCGLLALDKLEGDSRGR